MRELLSRLEYKRQALRRRVLGKYSEQRHSYFAIAGILALMILIPPVTGIEIPFIIGLVGASFFIWIAAPLFL